MSFRAITQRWFTSLTSKSWLRSYGLASIRCERLKNGSPMESIESIEQVDEGALNEQGRQGRHDNLQSRCKS